MDRRTPINNLAHPLSEPENESLAFEGVPVPARDPETVCHRTVTSDRAYYPQAEFHGRTITFCTETCQSVFLSDPERFYAAHSRRRP